MQQKHKLRRKLIIHLFDYRNWLLVLVSIIFSVVFVEVLLQAVHTLSPSLLSVEKQSKDYMTSNEYWKVWHYPNNAITHSLQCFKADYETNEFGLKDTFVDLKKAKIALIGDSYVEGYGVSNEHTIPSLLQKSFGNQIEVLNFGTSGGFGNVHAAALYDNFAQEFEPDIVIVFFLSYNDLYDNVAAIDEGFASDDLQLNYPTADSSDVFLTVTSQIEPKNVDNLPFGLFTPYFVKRGFGNLKSYVQIGLNVKFEFSEIIGFPYYPDEPYILSQGYDLLEKSLRRFKELQAPNLILVNFPTPFQVDKNWKRTFEITNQVELDMKKPNVRISQIAEKLKIPLFDPTNLAINYVDSTGMNYPYFYNECDKHFNKLGYKLMSDWLANMLIEKEYVVKSENDTYQIIDRK